MIKHGGAVTSDLGSRKVLCTGHVLGRLGCPEGDMSVFFDLGRSSTWILRCWRLEIYLSFIYVSLCIYADPGMGAREGQKRVEFDALELEL